jgi:hypothetical protein
MYVFRSSASSSTRGNVDLSVKEICFCRVVSGRVHPRGHNVLITVGSVHPCLTWSSLINLEADGIGDTSFNNSSAVACIFVAS